MKSNSSADDDLLEAVAASDETVAPSSVVSMIAESFCRYISCCSAICAYGESDSISRHANGCLTAAATGSTSPADASLSLPKSKPFRNDAALSGSGNLACGFSTFGVLIDCDLMKKLKVCVVQPSKSSSWKTDDTRDFCTGADCGTLNILSLCSASVGSPSSKILNFIGIGPG